MKKFGKRSLVFVFLLVSSWVSIAAVIYFTFPNSRKSECQSLPDQLAKLKCPELKCQACPIEKKCQCPQVSEGPSKFEVVNDATAIERHFSKGVDFFGDSKEISVSSIYHKVPQGYTNINLLMPYPHKFHKKADATDVYFILNHNDEDFAKQVGQNEVNNALETMIDHFMNELIFPKDNFKMARSYKEITDMQICPEGKKCISGFNFKVKDSTKFLPSLDMNERFSMNVEGDILQVDCDEIFGCYRALDRIAQATKVNMDRKYYLENFFPLEDYPRFKHRGILIDTSRHYLPVEKIKHIIQAASYASYNVIHWHMTDEESFPIVIESFPKLHEKGAYYEGYIYTHSELRDIVSHASKFGVRIYPEIDVPTHVNSWCNSGYGICSQCPGVTRKNLDPSKDITYEIIDAIITEMRDIFFDPFFHFGGDEVSTQCWDGDHPMKERMRKLGASNNEGILKHFATRLFSIMEKHNLQPICWEECLLERKWNSQFKLPKNTIVQAWRSQDHLKDVVSRGYRALLSRGFYLNNYETREYWGYYRNMPFKGKTYSQQEKDLLLGGEATAWSEHISASNWDQQMFPGLIGIAERLWSTDTVIDIDSVARIEHARCELVRRGVQSAPLKPGFCPYE